MPVPIINGRALGRKSADKTRPNVMLRRLRGASLNPPAESSWLVDDMNYMALNDELGCCTMSAKAHILTGLEHWGQNRRVIVPDSETVKGYSAVSGYDPKTGKHDDGATLQDSYDYMRKTGYTVDGVTYRIEAFAQLDAIDRRGNVDWALIDTCIDAFGGVDTGFVFPDYAMDDFDAGKVWDYSSRKRYAELGGHDVPLLVYRLDGKTKLYGCITWGKVQWMTQAFCQKFFEEYWTQGERDWQRPDGTVPNGIDGKAAQDEFVRLISPNGPGWDGAGAITPPIEPPAPPPPATDDANRLMAAAIDDLNASAAVYQGALNDFNASASMWRAKFGL